MFALLRMTALVGGAAYDGDFEFTGKSEFNPAEQQPYKAPSEFYRNEAAGDGLFHFKTVTQNNVGGIRGVYLLSYFSITSNFHSYCGFRHTYSHCHNSEIALILY